MPEASDTAFDPAREGTSPALAVIGTGYVGLTTGACLAHLGFHVMCADIDAEKVARLEAGEIPIVEDGLDKLVADAVADGRLRFVVGAANAAGDADIVFLCVPTPQDEDGSADLSYIQAAAREIAPVLQSERGRGEQVDRAGRFDAWSSSGCCSAPTSPSCPTRSSSAKAPPCTTSCIPTGS